ncbi:unnamed protein product [Phytomonas sp. Hart1]|nr:unnamed protein product [Phytomonas sp. Hart1]|eukprot:CCW71893.1 unnamed protein product [Phytomonas sp. isolate Hart1]
MEQKTQEYLNTLKNELREAGFSKTAEVVQISLNEYYRRHWYEMSKALLEVMRDSAVLARAYDLHDNVLRNIRADISPIVYVKLIYSVVFSPNGSLEKGLDVVEGASACLLGGGAVQEKHAVECIRAMLLLSSSSSNGNSLTSFNQNEESPALVTDPGSNFYIARKLLEELNTYIGSLQMHELEPLLLMLYCKARGKDYELRKEYTQYYKNTFDIVTYSEKAEMPLLPDEMDELAFKTAVAALLSDEIFNFGKFLNNSLLVTSLESSAKHRWVLEWLRLCNEGNVEGFQQFIDLHLNEIHNIPDLAEAVPTALRQKVRLTALLHLAFYTPFNERTFSFKTIANRCIVGEGEVEPLLLTALAHGIVHGKIDGLKGEVRITCVEPRVLRLQELKQLAEHIARWRTQVVGVSSYVSKMVEQIHN